VGCLRKTSESVKRALEVEYVRLCTLEDAAADAVFCALPSEVAAAKAAADEAYIARKNHKVKVMRVGARFCRWLLPPENSVQQQFDLEQSALAVIAAQDKRDRVRQPLLKRKPGHDQSK